MSVDASDRQMPHFLLLRDEVNDGAQSVRRAARLLRIVGAFGRSGASVAKIAAASRLHRATVHRMLRALVHEGLLEQIPATRKYRLGGEIFALGAAMGGRFYIKNLAQGALDKLHQLSGDTVYLGVRTYYDGLCLDMREGHHPGRPLRLHVNDTWPLGLGAFSMSLLAFLPDEEVDIVIERNARMLLGQQEITPAWLHRDVARTRRQGFASTCNIGQCGLSSVGVPIFDPHQRPIASLSITSLMERMDAARQDYLVRHLWEESRALTRLWCEVQDSGRRDGAWRQALALWPVLPPTRHSGGAAIGVPAAGRG